MGNGGRGGKKAVFPTRLPDAHVPNYPSFVGNYMTIVLSRDPEVHSLCPTLHVDKNLSNFATDKSTY